MTRTALVPNALQGGRGLAALVEGTPPPGLTRLGAAKVDFLIRGVAQLPRDVRVLELFGGTGLSTALVARRLRHPERLVSLDLRYTGRPWHYCARENYAAAAREYRAPVDRVPLFVTGDAARLPLADAAFDVVLAPDAPRTRFDASGLESGLTPEEQRQLFVRALGEALRVLRPGGVVALTAPRAWLDGVPGVREVPAPSPRLAFKAAEDPVVYARVVKPGG